MNQVQDSVLQAIGNTPVVRLRKVVTPTMGKVLVKLEYYNPTGSYKDRMALAMIEGAEARGDLKPGMRVVEWTGGSTGSSLAMVCAIKGYRFVPISSDGFADEKLRTMRLFGAELEIFQAEGGRLVPELYQRMKRRAEELAQEPGTFYTNQFNNKDALSAYMGIGKELVQQAGTDHVLAIEPDPVSRNCLQQILELNGLQDVTVLPLAIAPRRGRAKLRYHPTGLSQTIVVEAADGDCETVALDDLLEQFAPPGLIKLDIEGAEATAFDGASRLLQDVRPIWILETHDAGEAIALERLRAANYCVARIDRWNGACGELIGGGSAHYLGTPN